jgi:hypothetical protein
LSIEEFVPKTGTSIDNLGFLFGAGTSFESGYPLVTGLTKSVVGALTGNDRAAMDEVLSASDLTYDGANGLPNIEEISDLVIAYHANWSCPAYVPVSQLIYAAFRSKAKGLLPPSDE